MGRVFMAHLNEVGGSILMEMLCFVCIYVNLCMHVSKQGM